MLCPASTSVYLSEEVILLHPSPCTWFPKEILSYACSHLSSLSHFVKDSKAYVQHNRAFGHGLFYYIVLLFYFYIIILKRTLVVVGAVDVVVGVTVVVTFSFISSVVDCSPPVIKEA